MKSPTLAVTIILSLISINAAAEGGAEALQNWQQHTRAEFEKRAPEASKQAKRDQAPSDATERKSDGKAHQERSDS